jgi:multidrug efflux pump subunit AcrB
VLGPFFNDEFGDTYISLYAITGDGYSYPELKDYAKSARDILLRVPGVAKVDLLGVQEERVFIEVSSQVLAERGLSALDIQTALAGHNTMEPGGRVETSERSVRIDVDGGLRSVEEIRELRLRAGRETFRLGDISQVTRGLEDPPATKTRYQGHEAVLLGTTMAPGANVTEVGASLGEALKRVEQSLPVGIELGRISDQAQVVSKSITQFLEALAEAIGIVLVVSLLALGWRAAQLLLMSNSIEARERVLVRLRERLAHDFPNVRFKADRLFNGPPVGWPVQVRVTGPDRNEVRRLTIAVSDIMRMTPQISNVHDDWLELSPSLRLVIDQDRARALGVTSQSVRRSLQATNRGPATGVTCTLIMPSSRLN